MDSINTLFNKMQALHDRISNSMELVCENDEIIQAAHDFLVTFRKIEKESYSKTLRCFEAAVFCSEYAEIVNRAIENKQLVIVAKQGDL